MTKYIVQYYKGRKIAKTVVYTNRHDTFNALFNTPGYDKLMLTTKEDSGHGKSIGDHEGNEVSLPAQDTGRTVRKGKQAAQ